MFPDTKRNHSKPDIGHYLDSSSDEEDDLLVPVVLSQTSATSGASVTKGASKMSSNTSIASHDDRSHPTRNAKPPPSSSNADVDHEELARKARDTIAKRPYLINCAKEMDYELNSLLWHKFEPKGNKKKKLWIPCRKADVKEAVLLSLPTPRKGQILVKYIGDCLKDAGIYSYVSPSQLEPLVDPANPTTIPSTSMINFVKSFPSTMTPESAGKPLQRALEKCILEAIVKECWKKKPNQPEILPFGQSDETEVAAEGDNTADKDESPTDNNAEQFWDDEEDQEVTQSTSHRRKSWDPNNKVKTQTIRKGCRIAYSDPNDVAGRKILEAEVLRVTPGRQEVFKLHLDNGSMLRNEDRVKLVKSFQRGKLQHNDNARFLSIQKYNLQATKDDDGEWVGNRKVQQIKSLLAAQAEAIASNPETAMFSDLMRQKSKRKETGIKRRASVAVTPTMESEGEPGTELYESPKKKKAERRRVTIAVRALSNNIDQHRSSKGKTVKREKAPTLPSRARPKWWTNTNKDDIEKQIKVIEAAKGTSKSGRSRTTKPKMSEGDLRCVLEVRKRLFLLEQHCPTQPSIHALVSGIADSYGEKHDFSQFQLECFLQTDGANLVKPEVYSRLTRALNAWLEEGGPVANDDNAAASSEMSVHKIENQSRETPATDDGMSDTHQPKRKRRASVADSAALQSKRPPKNTCRKSKIENAVLDKNECPSKSCYKPPAEEQQCESNIQSSSKAESPPTQPQDPKNEGNAASNTGAKDCHKASSGEHGLVLTNEVPRGEEEPLLLSNIPPRTTRLTSTLAATVSSDSIEDVEFSDSTELMQASQESNDGKSDLQIAPKIVSSDEAKAEASETIGGALKTVSLYISDTDQNSELAGETASELNRKKSVKVTPAYSDTDNTASLANDMKTQSRRLGEGRAPKDIDLSYKEAKRPGVTKVEGELSKTWEIEQTLLGAAVPNGAITFTNGSRYLSFRNDDNSVEKQQNQPRD